MAITTPAPVGIISASQWGQKVVNDLTALFRLVRSVQADSTAGLTNVSTTFTDIPGCTASFSVTGANSYAVCHMSPDVTTTPTALNQLFVVNFNVDGALAVNSQLVVDDRLSRICATKTRRIPLTAGAHTIKLQAAKVTSGTFNILSASLLIEIFDID